MRNSDGSEAPALRDEEKTSGQLVGQAGFPSSRLRKRPEPVFLNVYGVQESIPWECIPPAYVAWRSSTITLFLLGF
jgi:hypothetical protein